MRGLKAAEAIEFKYAMQIAYFQLGYSSVLRSDFTSASRYCYKALEVGEHVMFGIATVGFFGSAATGDSNL